VTIRRDDPGDARQRHIFVRVDNGATHDFTYGHSIAIELKPGAHAITVGSGWLSRTQQFNVAPGEQARFVLVGRPLIPGMRALVRVGWLPGHATVVRG
jgi:hypothetical protein